MFLVHYNHKKLLDKVKFIVDIDKKQGQYLQIVNKKLFHL